MPTEFEAGVLYVSEEFGIAIHLCACGCGEKVKTPIGPTEWSIYETGTGPTMYPSIGNWQQPCSSHYFIRSGAVVWAPQWTDEEIREGRDDEARRRETYYKTITPQYGWFRRLWNWIFRRTP